MMRRTTARIRPPMVSAWAAMPMTPTVAIPEYTAMTEATR
jgi:hypothetical protein